MANFFVGHQVASYALPIILGAGLSCLLWAKGIDKFKEEHPPVPQSDPLKQLQIEKLQREKAQEVHDQLIDRLATEIRGKALRTNGNQFSEEFLKEDLSNDDSEHFDEAMKKLEYQGYAKRSKFKVNGPWWDIN